MSVSGWCSGPAGCDSGRAHATCQDRLNRGLLTRCDCDGHPKPEEGDKCPT